MAEVTREQVFAWCDANPQGEITFSAWTRTCAEALGGPTARTVRKWLQERREGLPPGALTGHNVNADRRAFADGPPAPKATAPAAKLAETDRAQALAIVRDARFITATRLKELRERVEAGGMSNYVLDAREAQALLNYQRVVAEVIETHPGLMDLVKAEEGSTTEEVAERRKRLADAVPKE